MSAAKKLREELHNYIDKVDEKFLKVVHAMFQAYAEDETPLGYKPNGTAITTEDLIERALASEDDIKYGRTTDLE